MRTLFSLQTILGLAVSLGLASGAALSARAQDSITTQAARAAVDGGGAAWGTPGTEADALPGGTHELGVWCGVSLHSGHVFGFEKNVRFVPVNVRYSYRFVNRSWWTLRYSPEVTALAWMNEPSWDPTVSTVRRSSWGVGLSPVGLELGFMPKRGVQPFFSENSGMLYFNQRVLSPEASQLLFSTDLGLGLNIFVRQRRALTVGYRYQHLSNANISDKNPGTDADTFYAGFSFFGTKRQKGRAAGAH